MPLNTLIVTIGDVPNIDFMSSMGIDLTKWGTIKADKNTLVTNRPGVFAGGDVVSGPNTVVEAIAAGKKAAIMIDRYVSGEELSQTPAVRLPKVYIEQSPLSEEELNQNERVESPRIPIEERKQNIKEVELTLSEEEARLEARRCLRCDLEFTEKLKNNEEKLLKTGGNSS